MRAAVLHGTGPFLVGYTVALVVHGRESDSAPDRVDGCGRQPGLVGRSIAAVVAAREFLTAPGVGVVLAQAAAVTVFAELRWMSLH